MGKPFVEWAKKHKGNVKFDEGRVEARLAFALIKAREDMGLTQGEVAKKVGMKQPEIARMESGEHNPTMAKYVKVVGVLGKELVVK